MTESGGLPGGKPPISCYRRYKYWSWALAVVLACLAAVGCNGGSGGVGTPGTRAPPSPASGQSVAVATSPESGGGNGGGGNAVGAPMNIPAVLASEGAHSVAQGEEDVTGVLENQYHCGPSLCNVTIDTTPGTDTSTCISHISVQGRGGYDPNPGDPTGIIVYPGDTVTFSGSAAPCAAPT
jgi:hypothetical protein